MTDEAENLEMPSQEPLQESGLASVTTLAQRLKGEVSRVVFGQEDTVIQIVAALLAGGHVLLEGKPGLGKTHMVLALASAFGGDFGRIGTSFYQSSTRR